MSRTDAQYAQYAEYLAKQKAPTLEEVGKAHGLEPKKSKYRNIKVVIDGITFDSKREGDRYCKLKMMERAGEISELALQQSFELAPAVTINGKKKAALRYVADFVYLNKEQSLIVEDVKGMITDVYKIKRHLMKHLFNIDILET